jgi:hypothetical protein
MDVVLCCAKSNRLGCLLCTATSASSLSHTGTALSAVYYQLLVLENEYAACATVAHSREEEALHRFEILAGTGEVLRWRSCGREAWATVSPKYVSCMSTYTGSKTCMSLTLYSDAQYDMPYQGLVTTSYCLSRVEQSGPDGKPA